MAKDVIQINGENVIAREDTAKAYRGVNWAILSVAAFVLIAGALFFIFFVGATRDGDIEKPSEAPITNAR